MKDYPGIKKPPKKVRFSYPEGPTSEGTVIKEVGELVDCGIYGDYVFVIQLIDYGDEDKHVRFGYYRKKPGSDRFIWGSQTTYHTGVDVTNRLINKANKEKIL
jgi:hypothetical protein